MNPSPAQPQTPGRSAAGPRPAVQAPAPWPAILVGGTGRSGTYLLLQLIGRHQNLASLPDETGALAQDGIHQALDRIAAAPRGQRATLLAALGQAWRGPMFRREVDWSTGEAAARGLHRFLEAADLEGPLAQFQREAALAQGDQVHQAYGRMVDQTFQAYARRQGARRWVEKTPDNVLAVGAIARIFPSFRLINIIRDGRDVACSLLEKSWGPDDPCQAVDWWAQRLGAAFQALNAAPPGSHLSIRYEDLVGQTERVMRQVYQFLGEDWDPAVMEYTIRPGSLGRWRRELPPEAQAYAQERYGGLLAQLGYPAR